MRDIVPLALPGIQLLIKRIEGRSVGVGVGVGVYACVRVGAHVCVYECMWVCVHKAERVTNGLRKFERYSS